MDETVKLLSMFFQQHSKLVMTSIGLEVIYSVVDSVIIPLLLADAFNNIQNIEILKMQLIKLVLSWVVIKLVFSFSLYFHNLLQPEISKFITLYITEAVFKKYEQENKITNLSIFLDRINLVKNNIHEFSYLLFTVFIPRTITLIINIFNIFMINKTLGSVVLSLILLQWVIITRNLDSCIEVTADEFMNKDAIYMYIEDLFSNINLIQSTPNGYELEIQKLSELADNVKISEKNVSSCINAKQYFGNGISVFIFSLCIVSIYNLHVSKKLNDNDTTKCIMLIIGLFNNMSDITWYIPGLMYKISVLKANENFLRELALANDIYLSPTPFNCNLGNGNSNINFSNVSFSFDNNVILDDFNVLLPQNDIISIYGGIGVGKSTFVKLIFKIYKPTQGQILIGGNDISFCKPRELRKYISYIDQGSNQLFNRRIIDNITYGMNLTPSSFLYSNVGKSGSNLSGGQKQIIHLLRIELNDFTKIVILDEPTSHLDSVSRDKIFALIKYINSKGKTILIITHDDYFKEFSDKVLEFYKDKNPVYIK